MEPIYTVLIIILIIWGGIFGYMFYLDKEVKKIYSRINKLKKAEINNT